MEKLRFWYFLTHSSPLLVILAMYLNRPILFLMCFFGILVFFSILDLLVVRDESCSHEELIAMPENDGRPTPWIYRIATGTYYILYLIALGGILYFVQFKQPFWPWFLYCIPFGIASGKMVGLCHDYMHANPQIEKSIARFFLSFVFYNVFEYEHLYFHHNEDFSCTDKDAGTPKLNQSVYSFVFYSTIEAFKEAFQLQNEIAKKNGFHIYNIFRNVLLRWTLVSVLIYASVGMFIGLKALAFLTTQTIVCLSIFAAMTYSQHYGLSRRIKNGELEKFSFMNIWASDHFITSRELINVTHHGHHHLFMLCRYPYLKVIKMGPVLPYGYYSMLAISFFPPLWFKLMNPRVAEVFRQRDVLEAEGRL